MMSERGRHSTVRALLAAAAIGSAAAPAAFAFAATENSLAPTEIALAPTEIPATPLSPAAPSEVEVQAASPVVSPSFDSARAWTHLQKQVAFGPRPSGSAALKATRDYLVAELKKAGLDARPQNFVAKTPAGDIAMVNLIATIP